MRLSLIAALLCPGSALAVSIEFSQDPYVVDAGETVTLDASGSEASLWCEISWRLPSPAPFYGVEFRWDLDDDGIYELGWTDDGTATFDAAGLDGPTTAEVPMEARCWGFTITSAAPLQGAWAADVEGQTLTIQVDNVPPVAGAITAIGEDPGALPAGQPVQFSIDASDPEVDDTLTYTWNWLDGTVTHGNPTSRTLPPGAMQVRVEVEDDDGGLATSSASFLASNPPPGIVSLTVPTQIDEGQTLDVSVSAVDPTGEPVTVLWTFPDGQESTSENASWTPQGEGEFSVQLAVSDGINTIRRDFDVEVVNVDPVFQTIPPVAPILEGQSVALSAPATDAGGDTLSWTWDFGDGSPPRVTSGPETEYAYLIDDDTYTVTVEVQDGDGGEVSTSMSVVVNNRAPAITAFEVPQQVVEGDTVDLFAAAQDVLGDPIEYAWDFGDGNDATGASVSHVWTSGTYTVELRASDDDGGVTVREVDVQVSNTAPVATDLDTPVGLLEGAPGDFSIVVNDAGGDAYTVDWEFGDGASAQGESVQHTYADDGTYEGMVTVTDSGMAATPYVFVVVVGNADPVFTQSDLPDQLNEGEVARYSAAATDPGTDTVEFVWFIDNTEVARGPFADLAFADDGRPTVRVEAVDEDGGSTSITQQVTVLNVAPTVELEGPTDDVDEPVLSWTVDVTDPGADTFVYRWQFGDGTQTTTPWGWASHTYAANGVYAVSVEVTDDDGGVSSSSLVVTIDSIGPTMASIAPPTELFEGTPVSFVCGALDTGNTGSLTYSWDFGDGNTGAGEAVQHTYADEGAFSVVCTIEDGEGRQIQHEVGVIVDNVAPTITSTPSAEGHVGEVWSYTPTVTDPGVVDVLEFSLSGPTGAAVSDSGEVTWTVTNQGTFDFELTVTDGVASSRQSWQVEATQRDDDGDGLADSWETSVGLDPTDPTDALADPDGDGRTNTVEFEGQTDPFVDDRPVAPRLLDPIAGMSVDELQPLLLAEPGDGRDVWEVDFELYADAQLTMPVTGTTGVLLSAQGALWRVDLDLDEDETYWWTARAYDGYGHGPWSLPESFVVNATESPPPTPVLISPANSATVPTVSPELRWQESIDPDGHEVTYDVRLVRGGVSSVVATDVLAIAGVGSWVLDPPGQDLEAFCWAITAHDSSGMSSDESEQRCFIIDLGNEAPSAPVILRPDDDDILDRLDPIVQVDNGIDPEGREVTIVFEISDDATFGSNVIRDWIPADSSGRTTWSPEGLVEDTWYNLRAAASDGAAQSDWDTIRFFTNASNEAPGAPSHLNPVDGGAWSLNGRLEILDGIDPEGFAVTHVFEVRDDVGVVAISGPIEGIDGVTVWTPPRLREGTLTWRARATDIEGAEGTWSEPWTLIVLGDDSFENSRVVPPPSIRDDFTPTELGCASGCNSQRGGSGAWLLLASLLMVRRSRR